MNKFLGSIFRASFLFVYALSFVFPTQSVYAAANLTITPITWNVVGLDSNNVNVGPNNFPVGARVCNNGDATANNVVADFVWDDGLNDFSGNTYINLRSGSLSVINFASIPANTCEDAYFEVTVTRIAGSYDQTRDYHITADSDETTLISTPTPREIYVEHLVSQNRNSVTNILLDGTPIAAGGTMNLNIGQTYTITLVGSTATNGYEQIESFVNFPNTIFQVNSVATTYDAQAGSDPDWASKLYSDACGWVNDPNDATAPAYRECSGTGKDGGNITITYNVTIIASSASSNNMLNTLIYDFSGSSYHYNSDFSTSARVYNIIDPNACTQVTIAEWTFPTDGATLTPSTDNAVGTPAMTTTSLTGPSDVAGNPTRAASYTNWNDTSALNTATDFAQFAVSTEGYYNVRFSYDAYRSTQGPTVVDTLYYDGALQNPTGTGSLTNATTWYPFSEDYSSDADLDDYSGSYFRVYGYTAGNTSGAMRLDNVKVSGCKLTSGLGIAKSGSPAQYGAAGETITYTYTLTNTGDVSLQSPYTITDDKVSGTNISCTSATSPLAPGNSTTCTGTYTTTVGDVSTGYVTNIASATSTTVIGDSVTSNNATETVELAPNLSVAKTNDVSDTVIFGTPFNWALTVTNTGGTATFNDGDVILRDNLPSGPTYGSVAVTNGGTAPGGTGTISCIITSNVLTCAASGGPVTFGNGASFEAEFSVTPIAAGSLVNPTGGVCAVDPDGVVTEGDETNNSCSNTVLVAAPSLNVVKEVSTDNATWNDSS
ncbi:MAG: hypothetical protein HYU84_02350, partial [Chloroflexi bacterium]|nr:hypothetical protein [Chloroflexota bacterium]